MLALGYFERLPFLDGLADRIDSHEQLRLPDVRVSRRLTERIRSSVASSRFFMCEGGHTSAMSESECETHD